jgi:hypothetical protein
MSKLSKKDGGPIDPQVAKELAKRYQEKNPNGIHGIFYGADILNLVLNQPDAVGLRFYFGLNEKGEQQMFFVAAKEDGQEIWPAEGAQGKSNDPGGTVGDNGISCPPICR